MPRTQRKQRQPHFYHVILHCYASQDVKEAIESRRDSFRDSSQTVTKSYYFGEDKRQAGARFARACTDATANPLAYLVLLFCNDDEIARVRPQH